MNGKFIPNWQTVNFHGIPKRKKDIINETIKINALITVKCGVSERKFCIFHIDPETDVSTKHFITETWNLSVETDKELETEKEREREEKAFNAHRKYRPKHIITTIQFKRNIQ